MPGQQGEVDFGDDGVVVADDAGKEILAGTGAWRRKLSRISCLTVWEVQPLARSSLRVVGRTTVIGLLASRQRGWV